MIFLIGIVSAVTCCERTTGGAWCQNVDDESECNVGVNPITGNPYRSIDAFCDATSYCKPGTCVDQQEGTCMPNTPQIVCEGKYGYWSDKPRSELPQCQLGCCLIGDQAAFVTQVSCNRMSSSYGLTVDYRGDISNEIDCLMSASPRAKGACVYTKDYAKTCELTTKEECQSKQQTSTSLDVTFHEGYLCSAQTLETICGKSRQTRCEGDDVYFVDTCGNLANIYDSSRINDENYWTYIQEPTCTPASNPGNTGSATCGDCDFYSGSMCQKKKAGESVVAGDYLCRDLDCVDYNGEYSGDGHPKHGESWCETDNSPGGTHYRLLCYNGEVSTEICDTTRQKICSEKIVDEATEFYTGNCKVNLWQDCVAQNNSDDCGDENVRDCEWQTFERTNGHGVYSFTSEGLKEGGSTSGEDGTCVPKYAPGFERDGSDDTVGGEMCGMASSICYVLMKKAAGPFGPTWRCEQQGDPLVSGYLNNCSCLEKRDVTNLEDLEVNSEWAEGLNNQICTRLGDCGVKKNVIDKWGDEDNPLEMATTIVVEAQESEE